MILHVLYSDKMTILPYYLSCFILLGGSNLLRICRRACPYLG